MYIYHVYTFVDTRFTRVHLTTRAKTREFEVEHSRKLIMRQLILNFHQAVGIIAESVYLKVPCCIPFYAENVVQQWFY